MTWHVAFVDGPDRRPWVASEATLKAMGKEGSWPAPAYFLSAPGPLLIQRHEQRLELGGLELVVPDVSFTEIKAELIKELIVQRGFVKLRGSYVGLLLSTGEAAALLAKLDAVPGAAAWAEIDRAKARAKLTAG